MASSLKVFVGGPIQHALRGHGFEQSAQSAIEQVHEILRRGGHRVLSAHLAEGFGLDTHTFTPEMVAVRDHCWMRECDVFVAVLCAAEHHLVRTDGTHVELGWASVLGKPVIVLTPAECKQELSHLVKGMGELTRVEIDDLDAMLAEPQRLLKAVVAISEASVPSNVAPLEANDAA